MAEDTPIGFAHFRNFLPGEAYPGEVVRNDWFEGIPNIEERMGVVERRFARPGETVISMAVASARRYIEELSLDPRDCRQLLLSTTASDAEILGISSSEKQIRMRVQRAAEQVRKKLEIPCTAAIGLNVACSGAAAIAEQSLMRRSALTNERHYFLAIASEKLSAMTDHADEATGPLFGDHVAVWVVTRDARLQLLDAFVDTAAPDQMGRIERDRAPVNAFDYYGKTMQKRCMRMRDGKFVMKHASFLMAEAVKRSLLTLGEDDPSKIAYVWPHPANERFGTKKDGSPGALSLAWGATFSLPKDACPKINIDIAQCGNVGSASWPRSMGVREAKGELDAIPDGILIASPLAGATAAMDGDFTFGNMMFRMGRP